MAVLLVIVVAVTRLPAPWRMAVTNDEAHHHLESWRNRYRTPDVFPVFFDRVNETNSRVPGATWLRRIYQQHPELISRVLFIVIDPQPPLWPVTAELIEAATHSSLVAQRIPSMLASCAAVYLAFLVGRRLGGAGAGFCVATLFAIGSLPQYYAGIARPYAVTQALVLLAIHNFIADRQDLPPTPRRFLLAALAAQLSQWMAWAVVGPFVVVDLLDRFRADRSFRRLLSQTWWYGLASLILLAEMAVQFRNPTISDQREAPGVGKFLDCLAGSSSFSHLVFAFDVGRIVALAFYFLLLVAAIAWLFRARTIDGIVRLALMLSLAASFAAPLILGLSLRFMMSYLVTPTILMGLALHAGLPYDRTRIPVLSALLLLFGGLAVWNLSAPYSKGMSAEPDWSHVAEALKKHLGPNDRWVAYPYFWANNMYRYGDFPEPLLPQSSRNFEGLLAESPRTTGMVVLVSESIVWRYPELFEARVLAEFPSAGYTQLLLRLPPDGTPGEPQSGDRSPSEQRPPDEAHGPLPPLREYKAGRFCQKPSRRAGIPAHP